MISYSQNLEDRLVLEYFGDKPITVLEIGANSPHHFSNSRLLIERGNTAYLLEPSTVCAELVAMYSGNDKVHIYNYGIGEKEGKVKLYESGNHVPYGTDKALVSSCHYQETERWRKAGVVFTELPIQLVTFENFHRNTEYAKFDFISIDVEGMEMEILQQIDLDKVGCSMLCVEYNGHPELFGKFSDYCAGYGMKLWHRNAENLIFIK